MSKKTQRKKKIAYFLNIWKKHPQGTLWGLKGLQRGKRNTPTYQKIQTLINTLVAQQQQKRNEVYRQYSSQFKIDIPKQSSKNITALVQKLLEFYTIEQLHKFKEIWYQDIVPDIVLKHVSRDVKAIERRGYLMSNSNREKEGDTTGNSHTGGPSSRLAQVYFTLGLRNHATVLYWDNKPGLVTIFLGEAYSKKINPVPGLWIGSHISPQISNGHLPSKYFGKTLRSVSYDDNTVITHYRTAAGEQTIINCSRATQIFSAENGLEEIFDGLLYQILVEIHYISGSYHEALFKEPAKVLRQSMEHFFIPDVYPEAKVSSGQVCITSPYISLSKLDEVDGLLLNQLTNAIRRENFSRISELITHYPSLINCKDNHEYLFITVIREFVACKNENDILTWLKIINLMLENGADINLGADKFLRSIIWSKSKHAFGLLSLILSGIPVPLYPMIHQTISLRDSSLLDLALRAGNWDAFILMQEYGVSINPLDTLLQSAYIGDLQDKMITLRDDYHVDCNAQTTTYGETVLIEAIKKDDSKFINYLHENFPKLNLNQPNFRGDTPLCIAVANKAKTALETLLLLKADAKLYGSKGMTPYELALLMATQSRESTAEQASDIRDLKQVLDCDEVVSKFVTLKADFKSSPVKILPTKCVIAAALLVKRINNQNQPEILFIRKKENGNISNRFLFPGGLKSTEDNNTQITAIRECCEESGLKINSVQPLYSYNDPDNLKLDFYQANVIDALEPVANDDAGEACWINWSDLEQRKTVTGKILHYYHGMLIETSNALLVEAILNETLPLLEQQIDREIRLHSKSNEILITMLREGNIEGFKHLVVNEGLNVNVCTPIALTMDLIPLELLIELSADLNCIFTSNASKMTPLILIIMRSEFQLARKLIDAGANFDLMIESRNALIASCDQPESEASLAFIDYLLSEKKAKLSEDIGAIALIAALHRKNFRIASILLEYEEIILDYSYSTNDFYNQTILIEAFYSGSIEFFKKILTKYMNVRSANYLQLTREIDSALTHYTVALELVRLSLVQFNGVWVLQGDNTENFNLETLLDKLKMRKLALQKITHNQKQMANDEVKFSPAERVIVTRVRNEQTEVLFVRKAGNKAVAWQFPELHSSDSLQFQRYYNFILPQTSAQCCYSILILKERNDQDQFLVDSLEDEILCWTSSERIESKDEGFVLQNIRICRADVLILQNFVAGKMLHAEQELDKAIFYKLFQAQLMLKAYLEKNKDEFKRCIAFGSNINTYFPFTEGYYSYYTLLYFDLKYNEGQWSELILSLGADVNYSCDFKQLQLCQAIAEKDYEVTLKLLEYGADANLEHNDVSAVTLLAECDDEDFKNAVNTYLSPYISELYDNHTQSKEQEKNILRIYHYHIKLDEKNKEIYEQLSNEKIYNQQQAKILMDYLGRRYNRKDMTDHELLVMIFSHQSIEEFDALIADLAVSNASNKAANDLKSNKSYKRMFELKLLLCQNHFRTNNADILREFDDFTKNLLLLLIPPQNLAAELNALRDDINQQTSASTASMRFR